MMTRTTMHPFKILAAVGAAFVMCGLLFAYASSPAWAAIITVNSLADDADGTDGECTLREAIIAANTDTASGMATGECAAGSATENDVINFALPGTAPWTVNLTTELPPLSTNIEMDGPGDDQLTVRRDDTAENFRIFTVTGDTTEVTISGLTISNGNTGDFCGGSGGGISNEGDGTVTVTDSTISDNTACNGGGMANDGEGSLKVTGSTISGNTADGDGGGIDTQTCDGAVMAVTVTDSTISDNTARFDGGGIGNGCDGAVTVTDSTISGNTAGFGFNFGAEGGGIHSNHDSNLKVTGSTISGNTAAAGSFSSDGGGIYYTTSGDVSLTITDSTISGNTAEAGSDAGESGEGGGIYSDTDLDTKTTITNSTISGNTADGDDGIGGGVYNVFGTTEIKFSTITLNTAADGKGSGVASDCDDQTSTEVLSSIISENTNTDVDFVDNNSDGCIVPPDINSFVSKGYNLIGDGNATGAFNQTGDQTGVTDPGLDPLDSYEGPTQTHRLQSDSPALDAIPQGTNGCGTTFTEDQRGVSRPQGSNCDIGSFELEESDTEAPRVTSIFPRNGGEVGPAVNVTATFSEDMREASVINAFKLFRKGSTNQIAATVTYDAMTDIATLNPTNNLRRGVTYKAVVTTVAKDEAGNRLDQNDSRGGLQRKVWFFEIDN
jgi:CSLREA domain-containing protein